MKDVTLFGFHIYSIKESHRVWKPLDGTTPLLTCGSGELLTYSDDKRITLQVLRVDPAGKTRRIYVKRRDLLRANGLQPRDLRRIDPSLSLTKTSPNITIKENVLVINLGGVRWGSQFLTRLICQTVLRYSHGLRDLL